MKTLKGIILVGLLALAIVPLAPSASALTCVGYGAGATIAEACNEARDLVYGAGSTVDHAERLAGQVVDCATGGLYARAAFYCVRYP